MLLEKGKSFIFFILFFFRIKKILFNINMSYYPRDYGAPGRLGSPAYSESSDDDSDSGSVVEGSVVEGGPCDMPRGSYRNGVCKKPCKYGVKKSGKCKKKPRAPCPEGKSRGRKSGRCGNEENRKKKSAAQRRKSKKASRKPKKMSRKRSCSRGMRKDGMCKKKPGRKPSRSLRRKSKKTSRSARRKQCRSNQARSRKTKRCRKVSYKPRRKSSKRSGKRN